MKRKDITISGLPDGFPVCGSQHWSSPALLPLTRCLPSGDHAIHRTQFLCPVQDGKYHIATPTCSKFQHMLYNSKTTRAVLIRLSSALKQKLAVQSFSCKMKDKLKILKLQFNLPSWNLKQKYIFSNGNKIKFLAASWEKENINFLAWSWKKENIF